MSEALAILVTLVAYKVALIGIGLWASRRTRDTDDFFLGGRRLGGLVAAVSASASSSSAWTLLGVSGAAYLWGVSALWLFPATVGGFLLNWLVVAPALMRTTHASRAVTLTEVIAGRPGDPHFVAIVHAASFIILFSFLFYIASQFQAAGEAFAATFELSMRTSVLIGGGIIVLYTLLGGFWAVSVTDTLQGLLMALSAIVLPVAALVAVGGFGGLADGLATSGADGALSPTGPHAGFVAAGFVLGTLGIGSGYPGQPHVVNRFMALRDERALRQARVIALAWAVIVYAGMLLLGLCGRVLLADPAVGEQVYFAATRALFPPVVAGVMIAAVLSAIMSTADSQLLVAASSAAYDLRLTRGRRVSGLAVSRIVVFGLSALAILLALYAPERIFTRVLFAWHAVGSAFGPIVLAMVLGLRVRPAARLAAMVTGFALTVILHEFESPPGDWAERLLPFLIAAAIALAGSRR